MLVERGLRRHSVVVGLAVHALSKRTIALSLAVSTKLIHIVCIVWTTVVRVVVWVACRMLSLLSMLHVLALRTRPLLGSGVRRVVPAVLGFIVAALRLLLTLGVDQIIGARTKSASGARLSRAGFLLALHHGLAVASVVLLILRALLGCKIMSAIVVWTSGKHARLG